MLQTRTVESGTLELLKRLMSLPDLEKFYLVGGTALALQLGHRMSIDIDLFTMVPFDTSSLLENLNTHFEDITLVSESDNMLITNINQVKVDFVKMSYPMLFPPLYVENVRMLDIRDIATMKMKAIAQRGSKKDFYDLYFLLDLMDLGEMLKWFSERFKQQEIFHIIKSLTYFDDAETYADPIVFDPSISWKDVKEKINKAVRELP